MFKNIFFKLRLLYQRSPKRVIIYTLVFIYVVAAIGACYFIKRQSDNYAATQQKNIDNRQTSSQGSTNSSNAGNTTPSGSITPTASQSGSSSRTSSKKTSGSSSTGSGSAQPTPTPQESLSALVAFYSDSQSDTDAEDVNHQRVVNYILSTSANPVFHAGDLMEDGTQDSLNRFNNVTAALRAVRSFYSAQGNNERNSSLYFDNFSYPGNERWFSVNIGNLHLAILDSAYSSGDPAQTAWLQSDLQSAASQSRLTGVMFHHPTYSSTIASILTNNNVDFVITGHNHSYAHSVTNGVHYFVTTGQPSIGYFLTYVYSTRAVINVYNSGNGLVDSITITNR